MKNLLTLTFLACLFTSCSTLKSSLNDWKAEIKEDMANSKFNQPYATYDNVEYSTNQPKAKIEEEGPTYNPYYIPPTCLSIYFPTYWEYR